MNNRLLKTKLEALGMAVFGILTVIPERDATFCLLIMFLCVIPMLTSKEPWD